MRNFLDNRPKVAAPTAHPEPATPSHPQTSPTSLPSQGLSKILHPSTTVIHQHEPHPSDFPRIELSHDPQGRISEIRVHCRCGELITLRCIY